MEIEEILKTLMSIVLTQGATEFFLGVSGYGPAKLELENDGFRVNFANGNWVRLYKYRETMFGIIRTPYCQNSSITFNQPKARGLWEEVTDALLAV